MFEVHRKTTGLPGQWSIKIQAGTDANPVVDGISLSAESRNTVPPASVIGTAHSSIDAIDIAEAAFADLPHDSVLTVNPVGSDIPIASMTTRRITGTFHKQAWTGRKLDYAETLGTVEFDATAAVLRMSVDDIHKLEDHRESTDEIGRACVEHDGPFEVDVTDSICAYFGIDELSQLTAAHLDFVRCRIQPPVQRKIAANLMPGILWIDPNAGLTQPLPLINGVTMGSVSGATKKFGMFTQPVFLGPAQGMAPPVVARAELVDQIARLTIPGEVGEDGDAVPLPSDPADAQETLNRLILSARSILRTETSTTLNALVESAIEGLTECYPRRVFADPETRAALVAEATTGFRETGNAQIDYQNLCIRIESAIDKLGTADNDDSETPNAPAP